ncbi:hypothetical protein HPP92_008562 [Vanilla planifolia]|uniref:Uncharacterized protein n=1 Tax=Vanilla planifolia TaxID=51239 RepID=A0A835RHZ3_VANPL|nr:hypothetical protein HPP92_008562 [Vanilla planifolia]
MKTIINANVMLEKDWVGNKGEVQWIWKDHVLEKALLFGERFERKNLVKTMEEKGFCKGIRETLSKKQRMIFAVIRGEEEGSHRYSCCSSKPRPRDWRAGERRSGKRQRQGQRNQIGYRGGNRMETAAIGVPVPFLYFFLSTLISFLALDTSARPPAPSVRAFEGVRHLFRRKS